MLNELQKLSKGMIIYSALMSRFEKLDFKDDALAGVRANFFNSNRNPQTDKTEFFTDNRSFSLSYSMRDGEPLLWKVTSNKSQYQKVKRVSDDVYCVLTYGDNGVINKRLYFDNYHNWLATEYYDNEREKCLLASVKPVTVDGIVCIKFDMVGENGEKSTEYLYPSLNPQSKNCSCLIYTNSGMIWYDATFRPAELSGFPIKQSEAKGFAFTVENFTKPAVKPLDLENAEYLSDKDYEQVDEVAEAPKPETGEYSAYDKIESILYEAHKTNKNIFGEVVSQSQDEVPEDTEAAEEIVQETTEVAAAEVVEEPVEEANEEVKESVEEAGEEFAELENAEEKIDEKPDNKPEFDVKQQIEPDSVIENKNGKYSYYGSLDDAGQRTGNGRTVSPEGITVYEGAYVDDKRDGFGVSYYKDGKPNYIGSWTDGNRNGCGAGYRHSDGTMHVGNWTENTPDGVGARFMSDGLFLDVCSYSMGTREGKSVSFDENGNVVITVYISGEKVAEKVITDEDIFPIKNNE